MEKVLNLYLQLLKEFVAFQSVSTDNKHQQEIMDTIAWLEKLFKSYGFKVTIDKGTENPTVIAEYNAKGAKSKALIYGHYDVQPASNLKDWYADPFSLFEKDGRYYARGVIDNKGQVLTHMASVFTLIEEKKLQQSIIFLFEGGEEIGSPGIADVVKKYKEQLKPDYVIVSDGEVLPNAQPVIEAGLRGIVNITITLTTSNTTLHSGIYGGAAPNAAFELTQILSKLITTEPYHVNIPEFYDDVDPISEFDKTAYQKIHMSEEEFKLLTGTNKILSDPLLGFYLQTGLQPALEITAIKSGYIENGYASMIPNTAEAKINIRFVAHQEPEKIIEQLRNHIQSLSPNYCELQFSNVVASRGGKVDLQNKYVEDIKVALKGAYGKNVVYKYVGGSIPIVFDFADTFKCPVILVPLVNHDCNMHGTNENFEVDHLYKALDFTYNIWSK